MMTTRKRVHPVLARILANCKRFHSSSSSPPRKRRRTSSCSSSSEGSSPNLSNSLSERSSHSVTTHSPSLSTRPSHKRCRSPATLVISATPIPGALLHICDNLLPPRKRIRGSSAALSLKDTIEESLDVGSEEDIDLDVMADIEADIAAEAAAGDEIRAETEVGFEGDDEAKEEAESSARGTIEIGVDRVFKPEIPVGSLVPASGRGSREDFEIRLDVVIQELYDHMEEIPAQRIANIEEEQRAREIRALADEREMAHMRERISVLEGSNMRL
ncbi:hypothetical protein Tco_1100690 [Tanacetum coccineum]